MNKTFKDFDTRNNNGTIISYHNYSIIVNKDREILVQECLVDNRVCKKFYEAGLSGSVIKGKYVDKSIVLSACMLEVSPILSVFCDENGEPNRLNNYYLAMADEYKIDDDMQWLSSANIGQDINNGIFVSDTISDLKKYYKKLSRVLCGDNFEIIQT